MGIKVCFKCGLPKDLETEFYVHPGMKDGHLNHCKECKKKDSKDRKGLKPEAVQEYERTRQKTASRREKKKGYERSAREQDPDRARRLQAEWRARNPEKYKAHTALNNALRDGRIVKWSCATCGSNDKVHGHHADYARPLEVTWLCEDCHFVQHGKLPSSQLSLDSLSTSVRSDHVVP